MLKEINKYTGFVYNGIKEIYAYRLNSFVWAVLPLFFLFIQFYLWKGIFQSSGGSLYSIPVEQYLSYIGIGFICSRLTTCGKDGFISAEMKNGNVVVSLLKPYSFQLMVFARHIGEKTAYLIQLIPVILVVLFITKVNTVSLLIFSAFLFSVGLSFIINFLFAYTIGIISFWITNVWGLFLLRSSLRLVFSGELIAIAVLFKIAEAGIPFQNLPIQNIPIDSIKILFKTLGVLSYCLPFQAMYYIPTAIYSGILSGNNAILFHLGIQIFWVILFLLLSKLLWKNAVKNMSVLGG